MVTMATGQNCRHAVPRVVKVLKSGYDTVITPRENTVETVVNRERIMYIDRARRNLVRVR